jgi:hypothetical protein
MGFNPAFLCRLARIKIGGWIETVRMGFSPSAVLLKMSAADGSKPPPYGWALVHPQNCQKSALAVSKPPPYEWALVHPISVVWHDFILEFGMILF